MSSRFAVFTLLFFIAGTVIFEPILARSSFDKEAMYVGSTVNRPYVMLPAGLLVAQNRPVADDSILKAPFVVDKKSNRIRILVTAYSSSEDETDDTPWITASGTYVEYGVVASNFLPIGARVRFPKLFGNKVFVVEDRMSARFNDRIDVWLPSKVEALQFGQKFTEAEIL